MRVSETLSRWKRPDYTGSNRCLSCTVVNVVLASVLAVGSAAAVAVIRPLWAPMAGASVFVASVLLIYFRGYLVPGTPSLTRRYFPRWLLTVFGKGGVRTDGSFDPDAELRAAGIVIEGADDLQLLPAFERAWGTAIDDIGTADMTVEAEVTQRIAALGGFDIEDLELVENPNVYQAWYGEELIASWESRAACIADVAAADIVPEYDSWWHERPLAMQAELLGALRLFLERCPVCHGNITLSLDVVSSCCYDYEVVEMTCDGCNARLFEVEVDDNFLADER
jgi:hypothetical protein